MKKQQYRSERNSRVIESQNSQRQPPLKDLIQAHFRDKSNMSPASVSLQPIQRLVVNNAKPPQKLFVSQSWLDEKYEGQAGKENKKLLDPDGADFKFKTTFQEVDFLSRFKGSWGINSGTKIKKIELPPFDMTVATPNQTLKRQAQERECGYINKNHTLYVYNGGSTKELTGKPVFHLFNYIDPDTDSKVDKAWEDGLRSKACVLISMIYERALAAENDVTVAKANIIALLGTFGVTLSGSINFEDVGGIKLPKTNETYRLVEALHAKLQEDEGKKRYDMSHVNEGILETQYELVAAPNCRLDELGGTVDLPVGIYLFHVGNRSGDIGAGPELRGHATTVQVTKEVKGAFPTGWKISEYFKDYNESRFNYNTSALNKDTIIGGVWKKK